MRTKEQILKDNGVNPFGAGYHKAMDEYAKQQATVFAEFLEYREKMALYNPLIDTNKSIGELWDELRLIDTSKHRLEILEELQRISQ